MDKEANAIKLTLKDGAINQEIYMESDKKYESYFSENVIGNKEEGYIFIYSGHIQDNEYESRGIDIDNKKIIKYPYSLTVNSIENTKKYVYYVKSNSEQFNSNIEIWLGELIDNKLKDVQMLDSYNYYDGEHDNIKNVLYDKKSHSFFIKRRINGGWSYEILKI